MHLFYVDGNAVHFRTNIFVLSSLRSISAGPRVNLDEKRRCWFLISQMIWRGFRTTIVWKHLLSASFTHFLDIYGNTINYRTKVLLLSSLRFILAEPRGKLTEKIMSWIFSSQMIWKDFRAVPTQEDLLLTCFMYLFDIDGNAINFRSKVFVFSSLRSISAGYRVNLDEKIRCWL